jgi:hypothetical protein
MSALLVLPGLHPASYERPAVEAHHAPDGSRRYTITVRWGAEDAPVLHWLLLNPSIAGLCRTADNLDPTLRRVRGFTRAAGFDGFTLVNLYSLVSTDPAGLAVEDPADLSAEGPMIEALSGVDRLVCAWGAHPRAAVRARAVLALTGARLECLGTTRDGWPVHPLYQPAAAGLRAWRMP